MKRHVVIPLIPAVLVLAFSTCLAEPILSEEEIRQIVGDLLQSLSKKPEPKTEPKPEPKQVTVADVMRDLSDKDPKKRAYAAWFLSKFGPGAAEAVPALTNLLSDPDDIVRSQATYTLARVGPTGPG